MEVDALISEFLISVENSLIDEYKIDKSIAHDMVKNSVLARIINKDPEVVMHYCPEYWAEDIIECEKKLKGDLR